jgi:hypothetical protein
LEVSTFCLNFAASKPKFTENTRSMETTKKRTREEVRAAFKEFLRKKKENQEEALARLEAYHQHRLAGIL